LRTNFLYIFLFYQSTVLSSRAVDGNQMYSGGSIVGKASTLVFAHPSPNFHRRQKVRKIINNSAGGCSISFKFRTDFDHVTLDVS